MYRVKLKQQLLVLSIWGKSFPFLLSPTDHRPSRIEKRQERVQDVQKTVTQHFDLGVGKSETGSA